MNDYTACLRTIEGLYQDTAIRDRLYYPDFRRSWDALLRRTAGYMDRWGVHSLIGFSHFVSSEEFIEYQLPLAEQGEGLIDRTLNQLREITSFESLQAIDNLTTFNETFEWDPGFALKVAGIPFSKLGNMSFANKSKLLGEIQALVDKYADMDGFERRIESY